nr:hypothetical protein DGKKSRWO_DGKKSRWO_CDS_0015 [uncultured phage]CAI9752126.1 hypothetical protein CVNMHQAP_CVNMHQAP_CDS_0015 [uncultured phage]
MKPYPRNNVDYDVITPIYVKNDDVDKDSRYSIYNKISNLNFPALEIKLTNSISRNETYKGYYYTTTKNETLYQIAKKYYQDEKLWWVIAKANGLKNSGISIIDENVTLSIPAMTELTIPGGYFSNR